MEALFRVVTTLTPRTHSPAHQSDLWHSSVLLSKHYSRALPGVGSVIISLLLKVNINISANLSLERNPESSN